MSREPNTSGTFAMLLSLLDVDDSCFLGHVHCQGNRIPTLTGHVVASKILERLSRDSESHPRKPGPSATQLQKNSHNRCNLSNLTIKGYYILTTFSLFREVVQNFKISYQWFRSKD
jgi:hypothetical protein